MWHLLLPAHPSAANKMQVLQSPNCVHFAFKTSSLLRNSKEKKKSKTNKRNTFVLNILSCSHLRPSKIINTYLSPFHLQNSHNLQISFIIWFQPPYCHFPLSSLYVSLTRLYALPVFSTFSCAVSCFLNVFFFHIMPHVQNYQFFKFNF